VWLCSEGRKKGATEVKGLRKLANYQNKLAEYNSWRRRASPEDIEYQEIEIGKSLHGRVVNPH
jgi:hypothetical protein